MGFTYPYDMLVIVRLEKLVRGISVVSAYG
jgi:hypothetical protein